MFSAIITHIPWYVYLIFCILIKRGINALNDRTVPLRKLMIFPIAMTIWALYDINKIFGIFHLYIIVSILVGALSGIRIGFSASKKDNPIYKNGSFTLRGSTTTLKLIITIFVYKFVTFSIIGMNPLLTENIIFATFFALSFTLIAGITLGRLLYLLTIIRYAKINILLI